MNRSNEKIHISNFKVKQLALGDLNSLLQLQQEVIAELSTQDLLRINTAQMLKECLKPPHFSIGAWHNNTLAAISILYYPTIEEENLARHLVSIDVKGTKTANYKLCIVRKNYRGNSLQFHLAKLLEIHAKKNDIQVLCATVSPQNSHCMSNMSRLGYIKDSNLTKYGLERSLYYKYI